MREAKFKETEIGMIPEDWEIRPLTELISNVVDNRGKTAPTSKDGIALIATNCIKEDGLYPIKEKIRYVSQETYDNWFRDHPKTGDIIIVNKGTPGLVCLVPEKVDFCIAQDMVAVRPNENHVYGKYLFTAMRSKNFKFQVDGLNVGTTIPHLKKTVFSKLLIPVPPREDQIFIGNTYCSLSEKIELNRSMNSTLEAIGQALFRRWFVDFEFPDEEGKPYRSSGGEMAETELGEVPKGWRVVENIAELCKQINYGYTQSSTEEKIGPKFLRVMDINKGDWIDWVGVPYCKIEDKDLVKYLLEKGDIVVARMADPGKLAIFESDIKAVFASYLIRIRLINKEHSYYLYYMMKSKYYQEFILGAAGGSVQKNLNAKGLTNGLPIILPSDKIIISFNKITGSLRGKINENVSESIYLSQIRDTLLPKLMSGEVRVDA